MSFQAFECEQPMEGEGVCVRLYGHKGEHQPASRKPPDIPQEFWNNTLAGQGEKLHAELRTVRRDILELLPRWLRRFLLGKGAGGNPVHQSEGESR